MSVVVASSAPAEAAVRPPFGLAPRLVAELRAWLAGLPGVERAWLFGSRARGSERPDSDIDLALDAPRWQARDLHAAQSAAERLPLLRGLDLVHWQAVGESPLRAEIERERVEFWSAAPAVARVDTLGGIALKEFQTRVLADLRHWLEALVLARDRAQAKSEMLARMVADDPLADVKALRDFPAQAWRRLAEEGRLPAPYADQPHSSRWTGHGEPLPNVCLKVPTGGGKTLLAAAAIGQILALWQRRSTGIVLWVVPNEAIYRQTLAALSNRDHPYRQMLNVAAAGRVKILEKTSPLTRMDVESHLCVMLLMLQSAARASKETLRLFRDRGNVLGFLPHEDDLSGHFARLQEVSNLDVYPVAGTSPEAARLQFGSVVKSSLGNVLRMQRPLIVMDEGHHAYTETALATLDGFNPSMLIELSATPRLTGPRGSGSNILCNVRGRDLDEAQMIKLPIHVDAGEQGDWQACLAAAKQRLDALRRRAEALHGQTGRYIRPILLVQVERTGKELRDAGFIHAEDAREALLRLGLNEREIAIKSSERNDLDTPENLDLLSPSCEIRAIVTKQALQEGWDCPFAYVLCTLQAGRNLAAMTQLVGRILRLPHTAKTGDAELDACWVHCHRAETGQVVEQIKRALEGEGMGDLGLAVRASGGEGGGTEARTITVKRREAWRLDRIFLPQVCWRNDDGSRRLLDYDSDVLAHIDWTSLRPQALAATWAPAPAMPGNHAAKVSVGLDLLYGGSPTVEGTAATSERLDEAGFLRQWADAAPSPWLAWSWWQSVRRRLADSGVGEAALARSATSLAGTLRVDLEAERDRLAEVAFKRLVDAGRVEFRLRADALDYELPVSWELNLDTPAVPLVRPQDAMPVQRSLYEPALRTPDVNDWEVKVAGYLDGQAAVQWWHRNVARTQIGLQGWRRHRVYPDFVFAMDSAAGPQRLVLLETKGLHLANADTEYKRKLLAQLSQAYRDERFQIVGGFELEGVAATRLQCELVFDNAWHAQLDGVLAPALESGRRHG
jgi:type III restriction enzyme